jgi:hypothetical protein
MIFSENRFPLFGIMLWHDQQWRKEADEIKERPRVDLDHSLPGRFPSQFVLSAIDALR